MAKKTATRKATGKKTTKAKKEISFKQVGRNVILIIEGEKFSKGFKEKAQRESIKSLVEAYNKRNSLKKEKEIINLMLEQKTTEKERKEKLAAAKPKEVAKPKQAEATMSEADAKAFLEKQGYTVSKKVATPAPKRKRYGGEH